MASPIRKLLIGVFVLLVLFALLALFLVPRLIDPERYRGRVERMTSEAIGRPVAFDSLQVSWWPLGLRVEGVDVGALPGEPAGSALRAGSIRVGARIGPLLRGNLEVTSITVERPVVRVVYSANGEWLLPLPPEAGSPGSDEAVAAPGSQPSISIDAFELLDGTIEFVDASGQLLNSIEDVRARIGGLGSSGPTTLEIRAGAAIDAALTLDATFTGEIRDPAGPDAAGAWLDGRIELSGPSDPDRIVALIRALELDGGRLELEIDRSTLSGSTLARLLPALLDPPPLIILDAGTTELSGRLSFPLADGAPAVVDLRARVREMRVDAGLGQPLDAVSAQIALDGERVRLTEFSGRLGTSDVAGSIELTLSDDPRMTVDLRSRQLDFDAVLAGLSAESVPGSGSTGAPAANAEPLPRVRGRLRIASGTLDTVTMTDTDATIDLDGTIVTFDPLSTRLYGGAFVGSLRIDLSNDPPSIRLRGKTNGVDLGSLSADALQMPNLLAGKLDAEVDSTVSGLDVPQMLASARGTATLRVGDGIVGTLGVIERLSGVSGVFGERALAKLGDEIGRDGTAFKTALGRIELDAGTMHVRELALGAAGFDMGGSARVEMLSGTLDGQFVLRLSPAISEAMRADDSAAAKLFWNSAAKRVEIPFTLKGPFSKPKPGVDLGAAARNTIRDRAESELRQLVDSKLGGKQPTVPAGETPTKPLAEPADPATPPDPSQLGARINSHRWRGSILARDLQLDGVIHGPSLARATLVVRDSRERTIRERELVELATHLASAADPAAPVIVPWSLKIDGEKLLIAEFPVTVVVTVTDADGTSARSTLSVSR